MELWLYSKHRQLLAFFRYQKWVGIACLLGKYKDIFIKILSKKTTSQILYNYSKNWYSKNVALVWAILKN
jgi:hypothetical protein